MKILLLIPAMRAGGAERAMSYLADYLDSIGHDIMLVTLSKKDEEPFYRISNNVLQIRLDLLGAKGNLTRPSRILKRFFRIRKLIKKECPDIIVSFMDTMNVTTLISSIGIKIPIIISERVDPALHRLGRIRNALRLLTYPFSNKIVVQTKRVKNYFPKLLKDKIVIIENAVPASRHEVSSYQEDNTRLRIIGVGRLHRQKGFDTLIHAFARIAGKYSNWDVAIYGDGEERASLQGLIDKYELGDRIKLPGISSNIHLELSHSDVMAFPSRYEGFPNALVEGMSVGLPVVAFSEVSGVEDIISDGQTGTLINEMDSIEAFSNALEYIIKDPEERKRIGTAARLSIKKYAPDIIHKKWRELLSSVN